MSRWPGQPGWDSESYWLGVATTFAFLQADHDTRENYQRGNRDPALRNLRLPFLAVPNSKDLDRFGAAVSELNEEAVVLAWRYVRTKGGEHFIDFVGSEGYIGDSCIRNEEGWRR